MLETDSSALPVKTATFSLLLLPLTDTECTKQLAQRAEKLYVSRKSVSGGEETKICSLWCQPSQAFDSGSQPSVQLVDCVVAGSDEVAHLAIETPTVSLLQIPPPK